MFSVQENLIVHSPMFVITVVTDVYVIQALGTSQLLLKRSYDELAFGETWQWLFHGLELQT